MPPVLDVVVPVHNEEAAHTGSIPSAGPTVAGAMGGPDGGFRGTGGPPAGGLPRGFRGTPPGSTGGFPGGTGTAPGALGGGARGAMGGLLDAADVGSDVAAALSENATSYTWVAAAVGANHAARTIDGVTLYDLTQPAS